VVRSLLPPEQLRSGQETEHRHCVCPLGMSTHAPLLLSDRAVASMHAPGSSDDCCGNATSSRSSGAASPPMS